MDRDAKVYVAGHRGLVGSALVRRLTADGFSNIITATSAELDLRDQGAVLEFFRRERPRYVLLAAARVGGILANASRPADFIYDNLAIEANVINAAFREDVERLLFLGSTCIYPREAPQPLREDYLLSGPLEPTNEWYAVAKIAGVKLCEAYARQHGRRFLSAMPTNLYGPNDNFDLQSSHVMPALIRKFHEAKASGAGSVTIWGTGRPRREFLHVDDCADACLFLLENAEGGDLINIGVGEDIPIRELAERVGDAVGFRGELEFDTSKPDGTPRKLVDTTRINALGWRPRIGLAEGIRATYEWFLANEETVRG